jgi:amino acid transporter
LILFYIIFILGGIASILSLFFDIETLSDMVSIGTLLAFTIVCASVLFLRYKTEEGHNMKFLGIGFLAMFFSLFTSLALQKNWHLSTKIVKKIYKKKKENFKNQ